jgi:hypothetical protein
MLALVMSVLGLGEIGADLTSKIARLTQTKGNSSEVIFMMKPMRRGKR